MNKALCSKHPDYERLTMMSVWITVDKYPVQDPGLTGRVDLEEE